MLNCEKCGANYQEYIIGQESDKVENWMSVRNIEDETKGLCPFCNQESNFYNESWRLKSQE